jgi:hypothetical protein
MEAARALQQEEVIEWLIPDMAQGMRVEHDRLAQLGWVYDGFGGYRKKAASWHPGPKLAVSNVQGNRRHKPPLRRPKVIDTWASRSTANPRFSR